jgi:ATP-dependent exoDNAse (exonuclease V) beta subunit
MFKALRKRISSQKEEKLLPADPDRKVWIHGKADLVMIKADGRIHILDYKSDMNPGIAEADFRDVIDRRYGGQMELYRHVCAKLFHCPIEQVTGDFYLIG